MIAEVWEKLMQGNYESITVVDCLDSGINQSGLGHVNLNVFAEEVA